MEVQPQSFVFGEDLSDTGSMPVGYISQWVLTLCDFSSGVETGYGKIKFMVIVKSCEGKENT